MKEWRAIKNYGNYLISSDGSIKAIIRPAFSHGKYYEYKTDRILRPSIVHGYAYIKLYAHGVSKVLFVHRLVAGAFTENPLNKPCVNHKDGNKLNNNVDNLEWVTYSENTIHAIATGLIVMRKGEEVNTARLKESQVLEIYKLKSQYNLYSSTIAKMFNVSESCMSSILNGRSWKHLYKYK